MQSRLPRRSPSDSDLTSTSGLGRRPLRGCRLTTVAFRCWEEQSRGGRAHCEPAYGSWVPVSCVALTFAVGCELTISAKGSMAIGGTPRRSATRPKSVSFKGLGTQRRYRCAGTYGDSSASNLFTGESDLHCRERISAAWRTKSVVVPEQAQTAAVMSSCAWRGPASQTA
jgi:hypothetical protein